MVYIIPKSTEGGLEVPEGQGNVPAGVVTLPHYVRNGTDLSECATALQAEREESRALHGFHVVFHLAETIVKLLDGIAGSHGQKIQCRARCWLPQHKAGLFSTPFRHHLHHFADCRSSRTSAGDAHIHDHVTSEALGELLFQCMQRRIGTPATPQEISRKTIIIPAEGTNLGDVNGDGEVNAADLTTLARHVAKIETITNTTLLQNADVTKDGEVTAADLTQLARFVAKIISTL